MGDERQFEKHFAYLLSTALVLSGTVLIMASYFTKSDFFSFGFQSLGMAMWSAGAVAFVFEFYLQRRWMAQIQEALHSDLSIVSRQLGINRIYPNRDEFGSQKLDLFRRAKMVKYLAVAPGIGGDQMTKEILQLLKRGVDFQFLVCDPSDPFFTDAYGFSATDTGMSVLKAQIATSINRLQEIQTNTKGPGKIENRVYRGSPGCYLVMIDDVAYFEPYFYGSSGPAAFVIRCEDGPQLKLMKTHFSRMWYKAIRLEEFARTVRE